MIVMARARRYMIFLFLFLALLTAGGNGLSSPPEPGWVLVWADEFDGEGLPSPAYWTFETEGNQWGWGNNEAQFYTDGRLENARVEEGRLIITARKEPMGGKEYTSARINTRKLGGWLYGRFEARMKLPSGRGIWPAFWMMPVDNFYGGWPAGGEIDIMEFFGFIPETIYHTIHTSTYNHRQGTQIGTKVKVANLHDDYHLYAVEWFPDRFDFYLDEKKVFSYEKTGDHPAVWPFDRHFYLILNCAVGGDWCYQMGGIGDTPFPQVLEVDYVRVYKWNDGKPHTLQVAATEGGRVYYREKEVYAPGEEVRLRAEAEPGYKFLYWSGGLSTVHGSEATIRVFNDTTVRAHFAPEAEMLKNGDFELGLLAWNRWVDTDAAAAEVFTDQGALRVDLKRPGKHDWQVQLTQAVPLAKGKTYRVSFDAWARRRRPVTVRLNQNHPPYAAYARQTFTIDKEKKIYSFTVTIDEDDADSRLEFDFGQARGTVWLDNVSMEVITDNDSSSGGR